MLVWCNLSKTITRGAKVFLVLTILESISCSQALRPKYPCPSLSRTWLWRRPRASPMKGSASQQRRSVVCPFCEQERPWRMHSVRCSRMCELARFSSRQTLIQGSLRWACVIIIINTIFISISIIYYFIIIISSIFFLYIKFPFKVLFIVCVTAVVNYTVKVIDSCEMSNGSSGFILLF